jgi:demethylmenaquinone methyltransferase / 2-methoxy-6-polyprenyl-1,4-benzoquinol methylase
MSVEQKTDGQGTNAAERAARQGGADKRAYVQQAFSEIAPRYDLLNHLLSFNIDKRWRRDAIRTLEWKKDPSGVYVDLCAGTLDVAEELAKEPGFHGRVIGADFAEPMLRAGAFKVRKLPVLPAAADALQLPLRDASVAGAIVAFGIRNVADLDAGLREVHRVLRPGGRFVILEFNTPRSLIVRAVYHAYFHNVLPLIGQAVSGHGSAYRYLPKSVANFPAPDALAARMRAVGFTDVSWTSLTMGIAAIHVGSRGRDQRVRAL